MEENEKDIEEVVEKDFNCKHDHKNNHDHHGSGNGFLYFTGFIGAAVFFISTATSFGAGVLGFLKAIVWPAFLVYDAFKFFIK